mmetsp:Transcript_53822/g.151642  ORF Transcript_53822/g.151642 Transcript_53822/m.151642 type:complete len:258 (-) Transcript_53822:319-1092(-)
MATVAEGCSRMPTSLSDTVFSANTTFAPSSMLTPVTPWTSPPWIVFLRTVTTQLPCRFRIVSSFADDESSQPSIRTSLAPATSIAEPHGSRGFIFRTAKPRSTEPPPPSSMQMRPLITGISLDEGSAMRITRRSTITCSAYGSARGRTRMHPVSSLSCLSTFCTARRIVGKLSGTMRTAGSSSRDTGALLSSRQVFCSLFHATLPAKRRFLVAGVTQGEMSFSKPSSRMTVRRLGSCGQHVDAAPARRTESGLLCAL